MLTHTDIDKEMAPFLRDNLSVYKEGDVLQFACDDYKPEGEWNVDEWEARQGFITVPATRDWWAFGYRLARKLIRHGTATLQPQGLTITLPCDVEADVITKKKAAVRAAAGTNNPTERRN